MNKTGRLTILLSVGFILTGCTASPSQEATATPATTAPSTQETLSTEPTPEEEVSEEEAEPTPSAPQTAEEFANAIEQASSTKILLINEDNDPNDLLGRPNGYVDAAVIYDEGTTCTELGVDCGVTIEIWPSSDDAQRRSDSIQGFLKDAPIFGTEYHTLNGNALLRITGSIKPSVAKEYELAFSG